MRVLLRKTNNSHYYAGSNRWTVDPRYARDFEQVETAIQLYREERLTEVEVVLSFDDPLCELALPIQTPH